VPRYLYAAPGYVEQAPPLRHPDDLSQHVLCVAQGATRQGETWRTLHRGDETVEVMTPTRFAMNSVGLSRSLATQGMGIAALDELLARDEVAFGRLVRVLPEWSLAPVQVHAITETRLLPARTRLFIEFLKARMSSDA
jgi:DNA-binding transcriptional LysR family regulator